MKRLGKYEIQTKLGQGAMGSVYKAWHPVLEISVALKTIQDARLDQTEILARFKTEGRALAQLRHPHVVTIYDADQSDGIPYIAMEYMDGGSLDKLIESR